MYSEVKICSSRSPWRQNDKITNIIKIACLSALLLSQIASAVTSSQATTVYDGVTQDRYISYLKLDGTNGAKIPIPDGTSLNTNLEYTFMLWFKPMSDSWGTRLQYAFRFPYSFECYFSAPQSLICESAEQCDKLMTTTTDIQSNQWAHLTVSGHPQIGSYLQIQSHTDTLSTDTKSYVIFKQTAWGWNACVGNCDSLYGFIGGLREFVYLNQYTTPNTASRIKNHYLTWDSSIRAYYRFSNKQYFNKDQFRGLYANVDSTGVQAIDYFSNDICHPPAWQKEQHMTFTKDGQIASTTIDSRWVTKNKGYEYSVSLWIRISPDSCTQSNPSTARSSCFIFKLDEVMMFYLDKRNSAKFYFFALQNYYESQSKSMFVPENQWINIQLSLSQYSGYEIRQYDMIGRMTYYEQLTQDMQEQRATKKFDLFTNFRGHARHFILYTEKRTLPIVAPDMNAQIGNNNCIMYYIFQPALITATSLVGQAIHNSYGFFNMQLTSPATYEYITWKSYPFNSRVTDGLVTYPIPLFDGIACNDQFRTLQLTSKTSYVQAETAPVSQWLNSATVEFWYRPLNVVNQTDYLFTLWGIASTHEFFSIYLDANKILICGPFGIDSNRSPQVSYLDYTEANRQIYRWFHLTCQYEYQKEVTGYLFNAPLDQKYTTSLASIPGYMPADTYNIFIGNNKDLTRGTPLLYVKEARVWPYKRSYSEIQDWRFRQIDPKNIADGNKMLAYLRLTEASYNEYNFASAADSTIPQDASFNGITYTSNQEITICPQQTYYMNSVCYLNPVKLAVAAFIPDYDVTTNTLYWVITANHSSLVNSSYFSQIQVQWSSTDPILNSIIAQSPRKYDLRIPAKALRDESAYPLTLNITNSAKTFIQQQTLTFVPISCKYYIVTDSNALTFYNNYTFSQASNDILIKLVYTELQTYCNSISFFNTLKPVVTFTISPPLAQTPQFNFVFNNDNSISVTIPKGEQSKFPTKTDVKILFQIQWTNSQYKDLVQGDQYRFQDVLYTINFNYEQQTVVAVVKSNTQSVLKNEVLSLNASDTYITGFSNGNQGTLQFNWICDSNFTQVCSTQTGPVLNITYGNFLGASGLYNHSYQFSVQVVWTQVDGTTSRFYAQQNIIWYNIDSPSFTLAYPQPVRSSGDQQQFQLSLANYDTSNVTALSIIWSIVPNLTLPSYYNLTQGNTLLTVPKGGFSQMTNYTISVVVQNKNYPIATKSKAINFLTQQPPFGGSASITPNQGQLNSTMFKIEISNWQSINRPIYYRVWSTTTQLGNEVKSLLTTEWISETATFSFKSQTTNPFLVEISDTSLESAFIKLSPTITAQQTTNLNQLLTNAIEIQEDYSLKYTYLSAIVNTFQSIEQTNDTSYDNYTHQQISYRETMIDSINKDIQNINNQKSIENGDSYTIAQNSISMLSQMLQDSNYINDNIAESSIQILDTVQNTTQVINQLITNSPDFTQSYASAISDILKYSDKKAYLVFNSRLLSVDSTTQQGILDMNDRLKQQKDKLMSQICNNTQSNIQIQEITTQAFDLQVQKFSIDTTTQNSTFAFKDEQKSLLNVNVQSIVNEAINENILSNQASFCMMTTHYKLNLKPLTTDQKSRLNTYASSFLEFYLTDETGQKILNEINLKRATEIKFNIDPTTFKNNQTLCMAYTSQNGWSSNPCQTIVDTKGQQASCYCNLIDNQLYTMFTDNSRTQQAPLFKPEEKTYTEKVLSSIMPDTSLSFIGILIILLGLGLGLTVASILLDRKDLRAFQQPIQNAQKFDLLRQMAIVSNQPLGLQIYKQDQIFSYTIPNKSNFSYMLNQLHPIFNILSKFDIQEARLTRFGVYFLQVSLYALFCISFFSGAYRQKDQDRNEQVIDELDVGRIFAISIFGMIALLPIPYSNKFFKSEAKDKQIEKAMNNHSVSVNPQYQNEQTQEQNILSPIQIIRRENQDDSNAKMFQKAIEDLQIVPKRKYLGYGVVASSYVIALIAIIVASSINSKIPISNQYCAITTFYFGLFGSFFITNVLKVVLNSLYAEKVLDNETSILRFVLSSDAVTILKDRRNVKVAEKQMQFKPQELDNSIQKTEEDNAPVNMNDIDVQSNREENGQRDVSQDDDAASIMDNGISKSASKYMSQTSPNRTSNYRIKSEEDHMRRSIDVFERAKNSGEKSDVRYSCVTENSKRKQ